MANGGTVRIIPRIDIKGPNLVKGVHLEGLRVLGKPERFARLYYENGADELIYMDVVASLYGRNSLLPFIEMTSREVFIPLTVGGGLRTVEDIRAVLKAGADKVALNTAAIRNPGLITEAARRFGSSTIVVSIEAMKQPGGSFTAYTDNGRIQTGLDVITWACRAEELGAGEILLTSIDREGTGRGFDLNLTCRVSSALSIPVIACGGAGNKAHICEVIQIGKADAVCLASMLHYGIVREHRTGDDHPGEGNTEFLHNGEPPSRFQHTTINGIKSSLAEQGVACRPVENGRRHD